MKTLTIGGATQDIFLITENKQIERPSGDDGNKLLIPEGAKLLMDDAHLATGGGATNAAAALQQLDIHAHVCCTVGEDAIADFVINDLCNRNIDCRYITTTDQVHTAVSCIIPAPSGNRTLFVYRGANAYFTPDAIPREDLNQYAGVYITSIAQQAASYIASITQMLRPHVPLIAHNPGSEELTEDTEYLLKALQSIDIFIVNAQEARDLLAHMSKNQECKQRILSEQTHTQYSKDNLPELLTTFATIEDTHIDVRTYMREIMRRGPAITIVTNGTEGVYVGYQDHVYFGRAPDVPVVCSVGAGDAFGSTFFGYRLCDYSIEDAIRCGLQNSASVIQTPDTKKGLCTLADLQDADVTVSVTTHPLSP